MDLIRQFCAGVGNRFNGAICEFYVRLTAECELLKKEKLEPVFKNGRCNPYRFLESAIKKNLMRYEDLIHVKEYISSVAFILSNRLKEIRIKKGHNLAVLMGYIKKAAYTEVLQLLQNEGVLGKKVCGNCVFLSELKPYICQRENIDVTNDGVRQSEDNPFYLKERKKTDKCQEGFRPHTVVSINIDRDHDSADNHHSKISENLEDFSTLEKSDDRLEVEEINEILKKRALNTKHKNTKNIYKRQHNVFINLYNYISEGYSVPKAMQLIAVKIGKNVKTVERDINEIRTFLNKEISYT